MIPAAVLAAVLAAFAGGCASLPGPGGEGGEKGRVRARLTAGEKVVPGATVHALHDPGVQFQEKVYQSHVGADGYATLLLPEGFYFITARNSDGSIFGYYGPNPLQVRAGEEQTIAVRGLAGNTPPVPKSTEEEMSGVSGTVAGESGPLPGAVVAFYLDAATSFRGPGYVEVETDGEGRFKATISPGRYFLVVRKRSPGKGRFGPLAVGDHFGYYAFNPLFVGGRERLSLRVGAVEVQRRTGWKEPSELRTLLSGMVRDADGRPLEGFRVFLHPLPEMLGKPAFVADPSGADGSWELWAGREGTFYLGARREIGRPREIGEAVGTFEGSADHSIDIRLDGREMPGLEVIVRKEGQ